MPGPRAAEPIADVDARFSSPDPAAVPWRDATRVLDEAQVYWISTVRTDGRPHVTSIAAVWLADTLYVTTGGDEQKAKNLQHNPNCAVTTGCNVMDGLDVVLEATVERETDMGRLQALADANRLKYGQLFPYEVRDGALYLEDAPGKVIAYRLRISKAFAFGKGATFSQTRYRFATD
jgi:uncharacterized pyridoxamine 5'-phosphate oxidase family protein